MSSKLKGIYDALDHGNYKNAAKLCSALLQKQPTHSLCKALHAVALERCGRRDEALRVCGEAASGPGVDDTVLSTCQVVYRRCRQSAMVVQMYDSSCSREPENEEFAVALFFATVREGDFAKSQQLATKLYKKFNKPSYLHWIIMSIILQAEIGGSSKALDLAGMMLKKAPINMEALKAEKEYAQFDRSQLHLLQLHLTTLRLQNKHTEALEMLEAGKGFVRLPADIKGLRLRLLAEAGQLRPAVAEARAAVLAGTGDWGAMQDYINLACQCPTTSDGGQQLQVELAGEKMAIVDHGARLKSKDGGAVPSITSMEDVEGHSTDDEVWNALLLFRQLQHRSASEGAASAPLLRSALLAELELRRMAFHQNMAALGAGHEGDWKAAVTPEDFSEFVKAIESYFRQFGHRSSCYFELKPFLSLLEESDVAPLLCLDTPPEEASFGVSLTALRMRRAFRRPRDGASPKVFFDDVQGLLERWVAIKNQGEDKAQGLDELLALAVAALVDLDRMCCRSHSAQGGGRYLLDAVAIAEMGLAANPHAFQLKVLLVLLYGVLGVPSAMLQVYNKMDIKNIQHESLSYLVMDVLGSSGCHDSLREVFQNVGQFHEDLDKDVGDALSMAFQSGVLHRVPEYLESLWRMGNSVLWGRAVVEEVLGDLGQSQTWDAVTECLGHQSALVSMIASKPMDQWIVANQDRSVLSSLHPLPLAAPLGRQSGASRSKGLWPTTLVQATRSAAVNSSALVWNLGPEADKAKAPAPDHPAEPSALEELLGCSGSATAQLRLSASLLEALSALLQGEGTREERLAASLSAAREALEAAGGSSSGTQGGAGIAAAVAGLAAKSSACQGPWSLAPVGFAVQAAAGALEACEVAQLVLQCTSAKEPWEKAEAKLTSLTEAVKALLGFAHGAPLNAAQEGAEDGGGKTQEQSADSGQVFAFGGHGVPCIWAFLQRSASVLIPVALWCCTALPKAGSGKKAKEGQEALHATRIGLRNLLSALQSGLSAIQTSLASAQAFDAGVQFEASVDNVEGFPGNLAVAELPDIVKRREQARAMLLEARKKHLQALRDSVGVRLALLKSRTFKP